MAPALAIQPLTHPPIASVPVPGSKSLTNRAVLLAALAGPAREAQSVVRGALRSEDTEVMVDCLGRLGVHLQHDWARCRIEVAGCGGRFPATSADLFVGNSGTAMRFLTAAVATGRGRYRLDGVQRMRQRPIADLLDGLGQLGGRAVSEAGDGFPPVVVVADSLAGGRADLRGETSSQYLSGLLMAAPLARAAVTIELHGSLVSRSYVDMTLAVMRQFGVAVDVAGTSFHVPAPQTYRACAYDVEPDASAAAYFLAAAAITGGQVTVPMMGQASVQGDARFADLLGQMGCRVSRDRDGLTVRGGPLHGLDVDMNDQSDCVMTLAVVACFALGSTTIRNVAHVRNKESDRIHGLVTELQRLGAQVEEFADGLTVMPRPLHGATVEPYGDHRMAMSLALVGLRVPGVAVRDPECVAKTYPSFFKDLNRLRDESCAVTKSGGS